MGAVVVERPPRRRWRVVAAVVAVVAVNVAMYAALATAPAQRAIDELSGWTYPGMFVLALVANAGVFIPIPYNAVVLQVVSTAQWPVLVALCAAAGSALGESTGWWVGRKGVAALPTEGRAAQAVAWLRRATRHPAGAFAAIFTFAAVPNYAFDVAGLASGAFGVRFLLFLVATFTGRLVRFLLFAAAGPYLLGVWARMWS